MLFENLQDGQALASKEAPPLLEVWQRHPGGWSKVSEGTARFLLYAFETGAPNCLLDEGEGRQAFRFP